MNQDEEKITRLDPSQLGDPVALKTRWDRADKYCGNSGNYTLYPSFRLVRINSLRAELQSTAMGRLNCALKLFGGVVIMMAVMGGCVFSFFVKHSFKPSIATIAISIVGTLIAVSGACCLSDSGNPFVFDKSTGFFWKGKKSPLEAKADKAPKYSGKLDEIHAIQLILLYYGQDITYELNLVLGNGSRINLLRHMNLFAIQQQAANLATFLDKPVWDATF